jgi:hypothetical protein
MFKRTAALAVGAVALVAGASAPAHAQEAPASVVIIHGVPDTPVDVYVNGDLTLDDFAPSTVTDPVSLPAGSYDIEVRAADAAATDPALFGGSATVGSGMDYTIVAHLTEAGAPTLTAFANDAGPTPVGQGCVMVRHTAAAPAVDVYAGETRVISGLANPESSGALEVPVGTISATVTPAGADAVVIGPADVPVTEGTCTIVYAIGSLEADNLGVVVQTLAVGTEQAPPAPAPTTPAPTTPAPTTPAPRPGGSGPAAIPNRVESGDTGLAADASRDDVTLLVTLGGLALLSGGAATVALARTRRD